jgi:hypothetical protein
MNRYVLAFVDNTVLDEDLRWIRRRKKRIVS